MAELRGQIKADEAMASHVSWRAGGPVARAYFPADLDDLAEFLGRLRHDEPLLLVGLGSNLLVREGGYDGTAIFTHGALKELRREDDGRFYAEAGVASPKLARFVANAGGAEAEFLAGIPGTVGGALAMNAGCHGGETWRYVDQALKGADVPLAYTASVAKVFCQQGFYRSASDAIQAHGGMGFTWEYELHLYLKRAKGVEVMFGDESFHRERVIEQGGQRS